MAKNSWARSLSMSPERKPLRTLSHRAVFMIMAGMTGLLIVIYWQNVEGSSNDGSSPKKVKQIGWPEWNYSSFRFHPKESNWDESRGKWAEKHGHYRRTHEGGRPTVLMVTGSSPEPSDPTILSHLLLRAGKNKLDYCRIHDVELYYNMAITGEQFRDRWEKLPLVRLLMLQHPEVEWIWWMDSDAIFTDMSFEPPLAELKHYNLVLYGEDKLVYGPRPSIGLSTANFMIRNCQWSLDLLDAWASMGTDTAREESGRFLSKLLIDREMGLPGDDQSGLVAMLAQDNRFRAGRTRWAPMVKLVKESEYAMSANGTVVGPKFEQLNVGRVRRVPFVAHFAGCLPTFSGGPASNSSEHLNACQEQLVRAFDFADNQVYGQLGFQPRVLGKSLEPLTKHPSELAEQEKQNSSEGYWLPPRYSDWDERRRVWMEKHPPTYKDKAILVSGSDPKPCQGGIKGSHVLIRGLKNAIDYARTHSLKFFYNNNAVDKNLIGWWSKLPLLKLLMVKNPSVEWIWWMDSDAVFTDMDFLLPFASYDDAGYNIAMYGSESGVFEKHNYNGINAGNFLIRNCQWSLDLLDRWASFGATDELRTKNVELLHATLPDRPRGWKTDDQCVLIYLLITEREKWASKVHFETGFAMSGHWRSWVGSLETGKHRPFVIHFAGCKPCLIFNEKDVGECMDGMDRTYNSADNQVLAKYGLRHQTLNSSMLIEQIGSNAGTAYPV